MKLSSHEFEQRKSTLLAKLDDIGEVSVDDTGSRALTRIVEISASSPGGGLPSQARYGSREAFRSVGAEWELIGYAYEYRERPGPGRRAYHFHGGRFHAHCIDARSPRSEHHRRATEVELFEAENEFRRLYLSGSRVSCDDLRAALNDRS